MAPRAEINYVAAICGLDDHPACLSEEACETDPISLVDIPKERVIKLVLGTVLKCYDVVPLYQWLVQRNREPTTQALFTKAQLQYITVRYNALSSQTSSSASLSSCDGLSDIWIGWLQSVDVWYNRTVGVRDAVATLLELVRTNAGWSRDILEGAFDHDDLNVTLNEVTKSNLKQYIGEMSLIDGMFLVIERRLVGSGMPQHHQIGDADQTVTTESVRKYLVTIHQVLGAYIHERNRYSINYVLHDRYSTCVSHNRVGGYSAVGTWLLENGAILDEFLEVEHFESLGSFATLATLPCADLVRGMNSLLSALLDDLQDADKSAFVWTRPMEELKHVLSV